MLLARKNPLAYRCSWRWRLLYAAAIVVAVAAAAGTLGVPPAQAQVLSPAEAEAGVLRKQVESLQEKNAALQKQVEDLQARLKSLESKAPVATGVGMYGVYPKSEDARLKAPEVESRYYGYTAPPPDRRTVGLRLPPQADWDRVGQVIYLLKRLAPTAEISADARKGVVHLRGKGEDVAAIEAVIRMLGARQSPGPDTLAAYELLAAPAEKAPARSAAAEAPLATAIRPALEAPQLDVVSLANSYSDALEKLEIADAENKVTQEAAKHKAMTQYEAQRAAIILKAAERRVALLRSIAEHAIRAAKLDVELLQARLQEAEAQYKTGRAGQAEVLELKARRMRAESQLGMLQGIVAQK